MIPSIFVSSTISDLHYLRDGIRDAIEELAYRPVMSEYGEIGYINPTTAAESCYRSVKQCQMVILIIGCKYGYVGEDGLSVTHREYRAAKSDNLPAITFVQPEVMNFKEVYEAAPEESIWSNFPRMDNPQKTFLFLQEVAGSESFNAILPITSVGEAKKMLKRQLAEFVGDRLSDSVSPMNQQIKDVLAEVRTLRNLVANAPTLDKNSEQIKQYLTVSRFLLNESSVDYRKFLEKIFSDLDIATQFIVDCPTFLSVIEKAGWAIEIVDSIHMERNMNDAQKRENMISGAYFGHGEGYELYRNKNIRMTRSTVDLFEKMQSTMNVKVKIS